MKGAYLMNTLWQILAVLVGSGTGAALASVVLEHWRYRRSRQEGARYLAIRLAFALEGYSIQCAEKLSKHDDFKDHEGFVGAPIDGVPQMSTVPESLDYSLLATDLLTDALDFPQRCEMASREADFWWNTVGDMDAARHAAYGNTLKMGLLALNLSQRMRSNYGVESRNLTFGTWDLRKYFHSKQDDRE